MKHTILPLTILSALLMSACGMAFIPGSGNIKRETRPVSGFDSVVFATSGRMKLVQGKSEGLQVETDDNLLQHIHTSVEGHTLYIEETPGIALAPSRDIVYTLNVKTLKAFSLDGSASVESTGLEGKRFELSLDGSGDISLGDVKLDELSFQLNGSGSLALDTLAAKKVVLGMNGSGRGTLNGLAADELETEINGSGEYILQGKVVRQHLQTVGSGSYDARKLESRQVSITISGSGDSTVWATQALDVSIFGSGTVAYLGTPKVTQQVNGSGEIYAIE